MTRRTFIKLAAAAGVAGESGGCASNSEKSTIQAPQASDHFELSEATIAQLQHAMQSGEHTAQSLAQLYLDRIARLDRAGPTLHYVIETNPDALAMAKHADDQRKAGNLRGPLHGIPIIVKDNIDTNDRMMTTAGSLALEGSIAPRDALIVQKLRGAGVVILGKANLSEWANFRSTHSVSGWSSRGGQAKNPYALNRNPSGSSSGSGGAVSANCCAVAVGTETDGSIVSPASSCGIVGIKPTVGLLSRSGIIPISKTQDTAGPMARTVEDAAILLGAMTGADPGDPATQRSNGKAHTDYRPFLNKNGLKGARIGVARTDSFGLGPASERVLAQAIAAMKSAGAEIIDPVDFPILGKLGEAEFTVLLYEFKAGVNAYLAELGETLKMRSLSDLIAFNSANATRTMPYFQQEIFDKAQAKGGLDSREYLDAIEKCSAVASAINSAIEQHKLDALVSITAGPAPLIDAVNGDYGSGGSSTLAAVAGFPSITVPAGFVFGLPVGISFTAGVFAEPTLIRLAYAFEQTTRARRGPKFLPAVELCDKA